MNNTINYFFEETNELELNVDKTSLWILNTIENEGYTAETINYIFCNDSYLHNINVKHLDHDTYTDIITFDYTVEKKISSDIYISLERVEENATEYKTTFDKELKRVLIHGILHLCGYKDKTLEEAKIMRLKEDYYIEKT